MSSGGGRSVGPGRLDAAYPRISAAVMTHRHRLEQAQRLRDSDLGIELRLACDTGPPGKEGTLRVAGLAWSAMDTGATHHLVLQDDVRPIEGLGEKLRLLISSRPDGVLSLFVEWGAWTASVARIAALVGAGWAEVVDEYVPTVALVMPAGLAREAARHLRGAQRRGKPDDMTLQKYFRAAGIVPHVAMPNLVEHLDEPSLAGNGHHGLRRSVCWLRSVPEPARFTRAITEVDLVPAMSWRDPMAAYFRVRDEGRPGFWLEVPARPVLAQLGLPASEVAELARASLASFRSRAVVSRQIGDELLSELWVAACCLGLRAADISVAGETDTPPTLRMSDPVARHALATMPSGALRRVLQEPQLEVIARLLEPLVRDAVVLGARLWESGFGRVGGSRQR